LTIIHESNPFRPPNSGYIFVSLGFFSLQCVFYSIEEKFKGSITKIYPIRDILTGDCRNKMLDVSESSSEILFSVLVNLSSTHHYARQVEAKFVEALGYNPEGHGFDSRSGQWRSSLTQYLRLHYGPEVDSASNRNEYQEYFLRGKGGRCIRLTIPYYLHLQSVLKSGNLSLLDPSGPAQGLFEIYLNPVVILRIFLAWSITFIACVFSVMYKISSLKVQTEVEIIFVCIKFVFYDSEHRLKITFLWVVRSYSFTKCCQSLHFFQCTGKEMRPLTHHCRPRYTVPSLSSSHVAGIGAM
jgi:hypothetical protein